MPGRSSFLTLASRASISAMIGPSVTSATALRSRREQDDSRSSTSNDSLTFCVTRL
ncbi:hypothetical protein PF008_g6688 [Phytophthora fragariae]|uniref:Uncharacterized protein n=1 Tax=Phytophthora fragariae TaxID=53985 RepID=A0A6G0S6G6_9STRA|nr:hypothetical protein PF008_g6688 [Phytophthora fragariae]